MTMSITEKTALFAFAALCAGSVAPVFAQAPTTPAQAPAAVAPAAPVDEEEAFDEKLREFGYWSGAAHGCVAEAKQPEVERKVLETFNRIGQLFGTDRAFFYAAAFGRGTSVKIEAAKCPEFLDKFQKATAVGGGK
jgi:hypothetical protein